MPERQYFYTPILNEEHNIGATNLAGEYVTSTVCSPASENPEAPGELVPVVSEGMICLRVDEVNSRCVISMPDHVTQLIFPEGIVGMAEVQDWQSINRLQIEADYANSDVGAPDNERIIDFTVEED